MGFRVNTEFIGYTVKYMTMNKIIVAFDGSYYSRSALNYALQLGKIDKSVIEGVFLEDLTAYHQFSPVFDAPYMVGLAEDVIEELKTENAQNITSNIEQFEEECQKVDMPYIIDRESGIPSLQLLNESKFADLIITGSVTYFSNLSYTVDYNLVSDMLANSHCPVMVVPEENHPVSRVLFAFDGSNSSIFAIKYFIQLFPNLLKDSENYLVHIGKSKDVEDQLINKMKGYFSNHGIEPQIIEVEGGAAEELLHLEKITPNSLMVMGAFGRNVFSRLFKSSIGKRIVKARSVPVFVAHD